MFGDYDKPGTPGQQRLGLAHGYRAGAYHNRTTTG
jgi:hypothetical protein